MMALSAELRLKSKEWPHSKINTDSDHWLTNEKQLVAYVCQSSVEYELHLIETNLLWKRTYEIKIASVFFQGSGALSNMGNIFSQRWVIYTEL